MLLQLYIIFYALLSHHPPLGSNLVPSGPPYLVAHLARFKISRLSLMHGFSHTVILEYFNLKE